MLAGGSRAGALGLQLRLDLVGDELRGDVLADDDRRVPVLGDVRGAELRGLLERGAGRSRVVTRVAVGVGGVQARQRGEVLLGALVERERRQRVARRARR